MQQQFLNQRNINISISQVGPEDHSRRPKSPQGAPRTPPGHPQKTVCVFGASRALPEEPPGPPRDPPRDPQGLPRDAGDPPKDPQGPPRDLPGPPEGTPESQRTSSEPAREAKGHPRPSQAGPAECAKRLNPPPPARAGSRACLEYRSIRSRSVSSALAHSAGRCHEPPKITPNRY